MKTLMTALLAFCMSAFSAMADGFSTIVDDVPLMPGFTEQADESFFWDKPEGRIATLITRGQAAPEDIIIFYSDSLRALGWAGGFDDNGEANFKRDHESLTIRQESLPGGLTELIIDLSPTPTSTKSLADQP